MASGRRNHMDELSNPDKWWLRLVNRHIGDRADTRAVTSPFEVESAAKVRLRDWSR